jgi:hypothetical protein
MRPIRIAAGLIAAAAGVLALATPAAADQPLVFGPFSYHAEYSFWNCGFEVRVSLDGTFENRIFVNPVRNINYIREDGTATNPLTGTSLLIRHMYTELVRPPESPDEGLGVFTERGLKTRVIAPGGGVVLIDAGTLEWRYPDGFVFSAHGNHQLEIEGDLSELCAALAA